MPLFLQDLEIGHLPGALDRLDLDHLDLLDLGAGASPSIRLR